MREATTDRVGSSNQLEKRRFHRVEIPKAFVHCSTDSGIAYYELGDLSAGGARLQGRRPLEPGVPVEIILFLPQWDTTSFDGRVRRVRRDQESSRYFIGVEFDGLTPDQQRRLVRLIRREIRICQGPLALWATGCQECDSAIEDALRKAGYSVMTEGSPLGILARLEDPGLPVEVVVVEGDLGVLPTAELLRQLRRSHPRLKFYAVGTFDDAEKEAICPLVEAILEPGTGETPFIPLLC